MFKVGTISWQGETAAVDCVILNYTDDGAMLVFERKSHVPDQFRLVVKEEGIDFECEVKWRSPGEVGVAFAA